MATIEERLKTLEKRVDRYRRATVVLTLVLLAGVTMGQGTKDTSFGTVTCRELIVESSTGDTAVYINTSFDGDGYVAGLGVTVLGAFDPFR